MRANPFSPRKVALRLSVLDLLASEYLLAEGLGASDQGEACAEQRGAAVIDEVVAMVREGNSMGAIKLAEAQCPQLLKDAHVHFKLLKQAYLESLLAVFAGDTHRDEAKKLLTPLGKAAHCAYPEAFSEIQQCAMLLLGDAEAVRQQADQGRVELGRALQRVLHHRQGREDPPLTRLLKYMSYIYIQSSSNAMKGPDDGEVYALALELLAQARDPPTVPEVLPLPVSRVREADVMHLHRHLGSDTEVARVVLAASNGNLQRAFDSEVQRMKVNSKLLSSLVSEYSVYRGLIDEEEASTSGRIDGGSGQPSRLRWAVKAGAGQVDVDVGEWKDYRDGAPRELIRKIWEIRAMLEAKDFRGAAEAIASLVKVSDAQSDRAAHAEQGSGPRTSWLQRRGALASAQFEALRAEVLAAAHAGADPSDILALLHDCVAPLVAQFQATLLPRMKELSLTLLGDRDLVVAEPDPFVLSDFVSAALSGSVELRTPRLVYLLSALLEAHKSWFLRKEDPFGDALRVKELVLMPSDVPGADWATLGLSASSSARPEPQAEEDAEPRHRSGALFTFFAPETSLRRLAGLEAGADGAGAHGAGDGEILMLDDEMDEEDDEEMSDAELQEGVENEFGLVGVYGEEEEEEEGEGEEGDEGEEMDEDEEGDEEEGGVETVIVTEDAIRQVMEILALNRTLALELLAQCGGSVEEVINSQFPEEIPY